MNWTTINQTLINDKTRLKNVNRIFAKWTLRNCPDEKALTRFGGDQIDWFGYDWRFASYWFEINLHYEIKMRCFYSSVAIYLLFTCFAVHVSINGPDKKMSRIKLQNSMEQTKIKKVKWWLRFVATQMSKRRTFASLTHPMTKTWLSLPVCIAMLLVDCLRRHIAFIITFPPGQKNNDEWKTKTELAQNHVYKGSKNNIL